MDHAPWHVRGTRVPDGAPVEWWVDGGRLSSTPVAGARQVPGAFVVEHGLVDAHVHLSFEPHDVFGLPRGSPELISAQLAAQRRAGVLAVRDAGSLPAIVPDDLDGAFDGVTVAGCGPFLAPAGHFAAHLYEPTAPARAPAAAAARIRDGWPWTKVIVDYPGPDGNPLAPRLGYEPTVLTAIADAVHAEGGRLAAHVMGDSVAPAIAAGVDSIEHGTFATRRDIHEMARRGIAWTPTLATVAGRYLERVAAHAPPARAALERVRTTLPLAAELGVAVLAGTDEEPHGTLADEVAALARYGLPPAAALRAATTAGHALLGLAPPCAGDLAALVTYAEDPRADLAALARPAAVLAGASPDAA